MRRHRSILGALALSLVAGIPAVASAQTSCSASPQATETSSTSGPFRITATGVASDVVKMLFPTWGTPGWQDDLVWYEGINAGGGKWYADVDLARHKIGNPEYGSFTTHVYAKQSSGVETLCSALNWKRVPPQAPSCTAIELSAPTANGPSGLFRIYARGVANAQSVLFPTWGEIGGQDDLIWYQGTNAGGGNWYVDIDLSKHKPGNPEYGTFTTHVYAKQNSGAETLCAATTWVRASSPAPSCTAVEPSTYTTYDHSGFLRIYAKGVANAQSVLFPTWGEMHGQDDLVWYQGTNAGGGNWYADIDLSKHKPGSPEYGTFSTHVYAKSANGTEKLCANTQWQRPQIIAFATGNVFDDGWRDSNVQPNGQLAMAEDIRQKFCQPNCPSGRYRAGLNYMVDLMKDGAEALKPRIHAELNALVKSAKINKFPFFIHINHEWILDEGANPFGLPAYYWAEYTNWNVPLTTYSTGWGGNTAQGLKPNFQSAYVRNKVQNDIAFLSSYITNSILPDPEAKKLFMGVDIGWETDVAPSAFGPTRIGYAALASRVNPANGQYYGPWNPPADFDAALGDVARDFTVFVANEYQARGIPKSLLFTHVVANKDPEIGRMKRTPFNANVLANVNFGVSSFGAPFDYQRINAQRQGKPWTIIETDPVTALTAVNGENGAPPPASITIYNWSDTMRRPFNGENRIPAFQNLFKTP